MFKYKAVDQRDQKETFDSAVVTKEGCLPLYNLLSKRFPVGHFFPARILITNEIELFPLLMCDPTYVAESPVRVVLTWEDTLRSNQ